MNKTANKKENANEYEMECRYARRLATSDPNEDACNVFAEAIVRCRKSHSIVLSGDDTVEISYDNSFADTCDVDAIFENMTMADWRAACDKFCELMLKRGGRDPDGFDWPTPLPEVTFIPEKEGTDVITRVHVSFKVDPRTYRALLDIVDKESDGPCIETETCTNCDAEIKYVREDGKRVVVCPECGTLNPLCNECEPDSKRCGKCEVAEMCDRINGELVKAVAEEE